MGVGGNGLLLGPATYPCFQYYRPDASASCTPALCDDEIASGLEDVQGRWSCVTA